MESSHKSSSHVQLYAETVICQKVEEQLGVSLEKNPKIPLTNAPVPFMQPDFYSAEHCIVGEIFAHIGNPKKAQNNKIANDILKMLLLQEVTGREFRKIIVVCDQTEKKRLEGKSVLAESIRQFGIELMYIGITDELQNQILQAQDTQKMTNAE